MTEDMFGRFVFVMAGGEIRLDRVDNGGRRNRAADLSVSVEQETLACRRKPGRSLRVSVPAFPGGRQAGGMRGRGGGNGSEGRCGGVTWRGDVARKPFPDTTTEGKARVRIAPGGQSHSRCPARGFCRPIRQAAAFHSRIEL